MSLLNCVSYVLTYQLALRVYMLTCQCVLHAYVLTCQCASRLYLITSQRALRAYVVTCLTYSRAHVLTCLTCLRANVPCMPTCSRTTTSNNKNKFSMAYFTSFWEFSSTFLHFLYQAEVFNGCYDKLCTIKWFNFCLSRT